MPKPQMQIYPIWYLKSLNEAGELSHYHYCYYPCRCRSSRRLGRSRWRSATWQFPAHSPQRCRWKPLSHIPSYFQHCPCAECPRTKLSKGSTWNNSRKRWRDMTLTLGLGHGTTWTWRGFSRCVSLSNVLRLCACVWCLCWLFLFGVYVSVCDFSACWGELEPAM